MNASCALRAGIGATLTVGALALGTVAAAAAVPVVTADSRATPATGAVGSCQDLGFDGIAYGVGIKGAMAPSGKVKTARGALGKDVYLDVVKATSGVITAAVVTDSVGYNFYRAGDTPSGLRFPAKNLAGPVEHRGDKLVPITGWYVCIAQNANSIDHTANGVDRKTPMEMCPLGSALTPEQLCTHPAP
jgi:hypothetical protein